MDSRYPETQARDSPIRIGPVGRTARALGAVVMAAFAYEWGEAGMTWFSRPSTPANPMVWVVAGLAVYYGLYQFSDFSFGHPWGKRVVIGFAGILGTVIVATVGIQGGLWATPLTWVLYWLSVSFLIAVTISYLVALFLGTPGCEVGGLAELVRRLRQPSQPDQAEAMWCVAGLHRLDEWEARRRLQARS